ncbi:MAG: hypothetical protein KJ950_13045 [Proteobacteria bacterium]|nr:hypothetical protein [Pseudomonadota bacterium]MBU1688404.1 hypothetical protein [Pseudomonadota bacterium]
MKHLFGICLLTLMVSIPCLAEAEINSQQTNELKLQSSPLDLAVSSDGERVFVLNEGGKLQIYSNEGELNDTIEVDPAVDKISTTGDGGTVYLSSRTNKTIQELQIEFLVNLDISGSPFQGQQDAPVVLAFYSDFQ